MRAYALQKTMNAMDLGVELGASTYVFWGGREGSEVEASKDPIDAIKRFRDGRRWNTWPEDRRRWVCSKRLPYERLDQLVVELLLGVR